MEESPFRFALNTSTIRCGEIGLAEMVDAAAEAGYDAIEPWVAELDAWQEAGNSLDDLATRCQDVGLAVVNLIGFFAWASPDEAERAEGFEEARRCFDMGARLGCPYVAAPPWGIHERAGLDLFAIAERYGALIDLGKQCGVTPLLEFWGIARTLGTLGEALLVAAECGRPEAVILADVFHMYKGTGHFEGLNLIGADTVGLVHVNDYPADPPREAITDADRVYPGDGVAPYADILARLRDARFHGMVSLELFNRSYWQQDAATVAKTGLAKLQALTEG
ncbi:MAG: sugar phosphate isomerase/epimerase family protein [Planctomycetota bacterium]